ncbi:MAG: radical SAM protein [bacterium]
MENLKYIYGPVSSWRLGKSLGIDLLSQTKKICTFDCIYCQINTKVFYTKKRKVYVTTEEIIKEIKMLSDVKIDYFTFSGSGESSLSKNLGEVIKEIKKIRKEPIAILTNSSLINQDDVKKDFLLADFISFKLDAWDQNSFEKINKPMPSIKFENILEEIKQFKKIYKGKLALQIMFLEKNKKKSKELAKLALEINPNEVQINTPLRPSLCNPLSKENIDEIKKTFKGLEIVSVYEGICKKVKSLNPENTLKRRGKIF